MLARFPATPRLTGVRLLRQDDMGGVVRGGVLPSAQAAAAHQVFSHTERSPRLSQEQPRLNSPACVPSSHGKVRGMDARISNGSRMSKSGVITVLAALALTALSSCGGSSNPAQPAPAPTPTPTPAPTPTPSLLSQLPPGMICDPTPPPVYGLSLKMHNPRTMDSRPQVINVNNFCGRAGFDPGSKFCFTRTEGDEQSTACDYLAVGKAADTGRWGPTWSVDDKPCSPKRALHQPPGQPVPGHRPQQRRVQSLSGARGAAVDGPCETWVALRPLQGFRRWHRLQLLATPSRQPPPRPARPITARPR